MVKRAPPIHLNTSLSISMSATRPQKTLWKLSLPFIGVSTYSKSIARMLPRAQFTAAERSYVPRWNCSLCKYPKDRAKPFPEPAGIIPKDRHSNASLQFSLSKSPLSTSKSNPSPEIITIPFHLSLASCLTSSLAWPA